MHYGSILLMTYLGFGGHPCFRDIAQNDKSDSSTSMKYQIHNRNSDASFPVFFSAHGTIAMI